MLTALKYGLKIGVSQWRTATIAYVIQFIVTAVIGLQVYQVLEASIGGSLEINKLIAGYDDTVISDLFNVHGASLSPLLGQLRYVVLGYLIISVFVNAGLLGAVIEGRAGWNVFWKSGSEYFYPFLKMALWFLFLTIIWTAIIWIPFLNFFPKSAEVFRSEITSVFCLFALLGFYSFGLIFFLIWSISGRILIIAEKIKTWTAIKSGFRFALKNYFPSTGMILLFLLLQLMVFGIYLFLENKSGMVSSLLIVMFFILQQLLVLTRWVFRIGIYGGVFGIYRKVKAQ